MEKSRNRVEVIEEVIQLFVDTIGFVARHQVSEQSDFVHDFGIVDDDLTCFLMQIEWRFKLRSSQNDLSAITTFKQIVDLIMRDAS